MAELSGSTMTVFSKPVDLLRTAVVKTKDLKVDTTERSKETPVVDEKRVETASREHEAPIHS